MNLESGLVGSWCLECDTEDHSPNSLETNAVDVELRRAPSMGARAFFNAESSFPEVRPDPALDFGTSDLTRAVCVRTDDERGDVPGDIVSKFDTEERRGFQSSIVTNSGVTSTGQPNYRHPHFGIDQGRSDPGWIDCGRPGRCVKVASLLVSNGTLYAATLETVPDEMGHLYQYDGGQKWADLGNPIGCKHRSLRLEI